MSHVVAGLERMRQEELAQQRLAWIQTSLIPAKPRDSTGSPETPKQTLNACLWSPVSLGGLRYAELLEQALTDIKKKRCVISLLAWLLLIDSACLPCPTPSLHAPFLPSSHAPARSLLALSK